jgi:tetratricopeptide (TPR) repeat protein
MSVVLFLATGGNSPAQTDKDITAPQKTTGLTAPRKPSPQQLKVGEEIPDWQARLELARVLSYAKRYDESLAQYEKVLAEKPGLLTAEIEIAQVLAWSGKKEKAYEQFKKIPLGDIDDETGVLLADIYISRDEFDKAIPLYRNYLKKHADDHQVRVKLAETLSWLKKYEESIDEFKAVLDKKPDEIQVRRKYAFVLIWSSKFEEAAEELKKTLK